MLLASIAGGLRGLLHHRGEHVDDLVMPIYVPSRSAALPCRSPAARGVPDAASLIGNVSLGIGALSYAGQFNMMAVADADAHPDIDVFAAAVRHELGALAASTTAGTGRRR